MRDLSIQMSIGEIQLTNPLQKEFIGKMNLFLKQTPQGGAKEILPIEPLLEPFDSTRQILGPHLRAVFPLLLYRRPYTVIFQPDGSHSRSSFRARRSPARRVPAFADAAGPRHTRGEGAGRDGERKEHPRPHIGTDAFEAPSAPCAFAYPPGPPGRHSRRPPLFAKARGLFASTMCGYVTLDEREAPRNFKSGTSP